jgi:hypothetical protein
MAAWDYLSLLNSKKSNLSFLEDMHEKNYFLDAKEMKNF